MRYTVILFLLLLPCLIHAQDTLFSGSFHPDSLKKIVKVLAADSMGGRFSGSPGNTMAASYIEQEFMKAGVVPVAGFDGYFMQAKDWGRNVIAAVKGRTNPGQLIIFSAHYDHIGTRETNPYPREGGHARVERGDKIFNGANDDASGVAALISLAKYYARSGTAERTVVFIAFTGEELGLKGSALVADFFDPDSIIANINIEMIGRPYLKNNRPYMTGSHLSDLMDLMNKRLYQYDAGRFKKAFIEPDPFTGQDLFTRSDNYSFALKGVPAHSLMVTSPEDRYYHNENDEPGTLNYNLMSQICRVIAIASSGLVKGEDTPRRIRLY